MKWRILKCKIVVVTELGRLYYSIVPSSEMSGSVGLYVFLDFISKEEWLPSSPDLNPMDFSIWSILGTKACAKSHSSVETLKKSLLREWVKIPQDTLRTAVEAFPERLGR